jgi:putative nucleotidyltransferase with HDIG domain
VEFGHLQRFLVQTAATLGLRAAVAPDLWQAGPETIRFGRVRIAEGARPEAEALPVATVSYSLLDEQGAVGWVHAEIAAGHRLPLAEAYGVVRSLSMAMHGGQEMILPLLQLKEFDEYTTTHSINVSVLSMALAEALGLGSAAVRGYGLAGLLHDLGKLNIPREILNKPGALTPEERAVVQAHPSDGARIILEGDEPLDLAAAVAYEHHRCHDGTGYPIPRNEREPHHASRLVHFCDVYDALRTRRPYRDAWSSEQALTYISQRVGSEFDPALAPAFLDLMRSWDARTDGGRR